MARQIIDKTKSATFNEGAINVNFEELYAGAGGGVEPGTVTPGEYGTSTIVGEDINIPSTPAHFIEDVNTLRLIKELQDSAINVSTAYGHEPNMVIHDGKAYITYMYQRSGTGENWNAEDPDDRPRVRLTIVNISTMQAVTTVTIAEYGNTCEVDGSTKTINTAGSPNIALLNGVVRVVFSADGILYRDYTISTGTLGNISTCYLSDGETTLSATKAHFTQLFDETTGGFGVNGQYAKIDDKYYIAVVNGESGNNGNIFTTEDFETFTFWVKPSIPAIGERLGFEFEMALYPWLDVNGHCRLYFALRRSKTLKNMIVGAMYTGIAYSSANHVFIDDTERTGHEGHTAGTIIGYRLVPCNSSRPCFFAPSGDTDVLNTNGISNIFLAYDNVSQAYAYRQYTDMLYLTENNEDVNESSMRRIAQCLKLTYPSILYNGGYYYAAYQGKIDGDAQPHVMLAKFRPFSANWDKVIAGLSKMLDTFEPSNT